MLDQTGLDYMFINHTDQIIVKGDMMHLVSGNTMPSMVKMVLSRVNKSVH